MISSAHLGFQLPVHFETFWLFVFSPTPTSFPGSSAHLVDALLSVLGNRDFLKRKMAEVLTFAQEVMARWEHATDVHKRNCTWLRGWRRLLGGNEQERKLLS